MDFLTLEGATRYHFQKDEWLVRPGEKVEYVYYILSGIVIGNITNESGNEYLYDQIPCDNGINSLALLGMLFDNERVSIVGSVALTDVECFRIPAESILNYLYENPGELMKFTSKLMHIYIDNIKKHATRCEKKTIERLCQFMVENSTKQDSGYVVWKKLTNEELSKVLGVHPVTLSRMFTGLRKQEMIEKIQGGWRILDMQALVDGMRGLREIPYRY